MASGTVQDRRTWEEQEYARKAWHYANCEGVTRRVLRLARETEENRRLLAGEFTVKRSTAAQIRATLEKRAKVERQLATLDGQLGSQLQGLPARDDRLAAIRDCLSAGISQAQLAVLLDVSRQRVGQLVREAEEIPL